MEYKVLRGTGATVSKLCLGTMTFGGQVDETTSIRIVDEAIDNGINFVDTADVYVKGESEKIVGKALKGKRDSIVLASKVANLVGEDKFRDRGLHRWHIINGVEASLKRLQVDCLDICYLHHPDRNTPIEETLAAMDLLFKQGKVNYLGMSNFASWQVCQALWKSDVNRWAKPVVLQLPYNLITRSVDEECVEFSQKMNLGMVVYNPIAAGMLAGKHTREKAIEGTRMANNLQYINRYWHAANFDAVDALQEIAKTSGLTILQLAFRWLMSKDFVDSTIIGVSKLEQLRANIDAADGIVDDAVAKECDEVWANLRGPHFKYNR